MNFLPGLEGKKFSVIYADPPWRFIKYSEKDNWELVPKFNTGSLRKFFNS